MNTIALHYPSQYEPPVGVWWFEDGHVHSHYLPEHEADAQVLAGELAGVTAVDEWQGTLTRVQQRTTRDRLRSTNSRWPPLDFLFSTIRHWALTRS
jgi:hypothetical protein